MIFKKTLITQNTYKITLSLLIGLAIIIFLYTFKLSYNRYQNFEFGKFDLGNMSQTVWNTSRGNFMEVTDQFGGNMKRFGMSHADWILALLAPIYWVFPHPMILVFIQNIFIVSGCVPIYFLIRKFTKNDYLAFISGLTYLLYPAHGFLLVWSEYHGVAHVAPLLIWMFWYLDKLNYSFKKFSQALIFWIIFIVMLSGKEQIGFILGLFGVYVFFKNKKLGVEMFVAGIAYSLFCFLILIPHYAPERNESVTNFLNLIGYGAKLQNDVTGENFFLNRYTYLGSGYGDILKNITLNPLLFFKMWSSPDKIENLNYMFLPLGYISLLFPFWLIALPDYLIALPADVKGFLSIENQRVSMIIAALFINYALFVSFLNRNTLTRKIKGAYLFVIACFILTIYASIISKNPLFTNGVNLIQNKIITKVFSKNENENKKEILAIGDIRKANLPDSTVECRQNILKIIYEVDPQYYSGPDQLGAYTSLRRMNALFPAGVDKTDLFVSDIFDIKAYASLEKINEIEANKNVVKKMINVDKSFQHIYSCGRMSVFRKTGVETPKSEVMEPIQDTSKGIKLDNKGQSLKVTINKVPDFTTDNKKVVYTLTKPGFIAIDRSPYWRIRNDKDEDVLSFLDYKFWASPTDWDNVKPNYSETNEYDLSFVYNSLKPGKYKVLYGFGTFGAAQEVYAFDMEVK